MKYRVYGLFTGSKFLGEFEASSAEEAEQMASSCDSNYASLCHQCTDELELNDHSAHSFSVEEA